MADPRRVHAALQRKTSNGLAERVHSAGPRSSGPRVDLEAHELVAPPADGGPRVVDVRLEGRELGLEALYYFSPAAALAISASRASFAASRHDARFTRQAAGSVSYMPPRDRRRRVRVVAEATPSPSLAARDEGGPHYKPPRRDAPQGVEHDEFRRGLTDAGRGALLGEPPLRALHCRGGAERAALERLPLGDFEVREAGHEAMGLPGAARRLQRRSMWRACIESNPHPRECASVSSVRRPGARPEQQCGAGRSMLLTEFWQQGHCHYCQTGRLVA